MNNTNTIRTTQSTASLPECRGFSTFDPFYPSLRESVAKVTDSCRDG